MPRIIATPGSVGYDIAEVDADGVGVRVLTIYKPGGPHHRGAEEDAARLLTLALSLPGGAKGAIELLRAELVRVEQ